MEKVDYDNVADVYDYRYQKSYSTGGIHLKLRDINRQYVIRKILEVGCGTGHWLSVFEKDTTVIGLDQSFAMLSKAKNEEQPGEYQDSCHFIPNEKHHRDIPHFPRRALSY